MSLIFLASTDMGSTRNTSRFIGPFLTWLKPNISAEAIHDVQVAVRKAGHVIGYAILATLTLRALNRGLFNAWTGRSAAMAAGMTVACAFCDEFHQSMVPTRMGSGWDVLIDAMGGVVGLSVVWTIGRVKRTW